MILTTRKCLLLALALSFLGAQPLSAQTKSLIIPEGWLPALSPSIKYALNQLREANSQAEMNSLSRQVAEMTDAQLFIVYTRLYERLSAKERAGPGRGTNEVAQGAGRRPRMRESNPPAVRSHRSKRTMPKSPLPRNDWWNSGLG
jgi:hypothetical protein